MLKLTVVSPSKKIITDQEVESVYIPADKGELNILEGHAPLITSLSTGILRYKVKGSPEVSVVISWGYCEVLNDQVDVLAETAESIADIDIERAKHALNIAESKLLSGDLLPDEAEKYLNKSKRAAVRLQVADEHQRSQTTH